MKYKKSGYYAVCMILIVTILVNLISGCGLKVSAEDMMKNISPNAVTGRAIDDEFIKSMSNFSVELFKKSINSGKNSLISPLSVVLALSMTANGAAGNTLAQMEKVLGQEIALGRLNEYLFEYAKKLPSSKKSKLEIANSIWYKDDASLDVKKEFLQKNADYYGAGAYKSAFDAKTLKDINKWCDYNTDGMIEKILERINPDMIMYLINAVVFDSEWETKYKKSNINDGTFTSISGEERTVDMMASGESLYINDGMATGFIKKYLGGNYSFAAFLPNEGISVDEYISGMTGEKLISSIKNAISAEVSAQLPKFSYEYKIELSKTLQQMGMTDAFDSYHADFSNMCANAIGNVFIGEVIHKTFISVDANGTKAAAITSVGMKCESAAPQEQYVVKLDRPFVYAIIDNSTNLPIFIGTVLDIN